MKYCEIIYLEEYGKLPGQLLLTSWKQWLKFSLGFGKYKRSGKGMCIFQNAWLFIASLKRSGNTKRRVGKEERGEDCGNWFLGTRFGWKTNTQLCRTPCLVYLKICMFSPPILCLKKDVTKIKQNKKDPLCVCGNQCTIKDKSD